MKDFLFARLINIYPPFLGAGIRVKRISPDYTEIDVQMKLRFWNRNYVGTQFGGSLYAMTDPFYMMMLIKNLGPDYIVWDKAASIEFLKPGLGTVNAHFRLSKIQVEEIRNLANNQYKTEPDLSIDIVDEEGVVIARVHKKLYVRRKDRVKKDKNELAKI